MGVAVGDCIPLGRSFCLCPSKHPAGVVSYAIFSPDSGRTGWGRTVGSGTQTHSSVNVDRPYASNDGRCRDGQLSSFGAANRLLACGPQFACGCDDARGRGPQRPREYCRIAKNGLSSSSPSSAPPKWIAITTAVAAASTSSTLTTTLCTFLRRSTSFFVRRGGRWLWLRIRQSSGGRRRGRVSEGRRRGRRLPR